MAPGPAAAAAAAPGKLLEIWGASPRTTKSEIPGVRLTNLTSLSGDPDAQKI